MDMEHFPDDTYHTEYIEISDGGPVVAAGPTYVEQVELDI